MDQKWIVPNCHLEVGWFWSVVFCGSTVNLFAPPSNISCFYRVLFVGGYWFSSLVFGHPWIICYFLSLVVRTVGWNLSIGIVVRVFALVQCCCNVVTRYSVYWDVFLFVVLINVAALFFLFGSCLFAERYCVSFCEKVENNSKYIIVVNTCILSLFKTVGYFVNTLCISLFMWDNAVVVGNTYNWRHTEIFSTGHTLTVNLWSGMS